MTIDRIGYSLGTLLSPEEMLLAGKEANNNYNTDSIWVPESWGREAFSSLGALSQVTDRVKLGTSIVSIYSRSASTIAMSAATVDLLSNRRMVIGLGVSTPILAENWHGLRFESPVKRMKEYIECIRLILTGDLVNYNGNFCKIRNFRLAFRPKRHKIPVFLAAVNQRMILLSASIGDGLVLYLRPEHEIRKVVSTIRSIRPQRDFEIACVFITCVSDKYPEKGRDRAAKTVAFYVAVGRYYNKFLAENGFRDEVRNITDEYNSRGLNAASKLVTDKMLSSLAIYGSREDCIKAIKRFMATGISLPIIQINPLENIEGSFRETLTLLNGND
jgi:5,10-methylenetetrahydromethanopterin reductase